MGISTFTSKEFVNFCRVSKIGNVLGRLCHIMAYMGDESPHILPAILGQATRLMAMAISELTGYFYGIIQTFYFDGVFLVVITGITRA